MKNLKSFIARMSCKIQPSPRGETLIYEIIYTTEATHQVLYTLLTIAEHTNFINNATINEDVNKYAECMIHVLSIYLGTRL